MGQIEKVIQRTREIESLLDQLGASGRGLHEKITSIEAQLDNVTIKKLRWIATMRNKIVHEPDFLIDDFKGFRDSCSTIVSQLKAMLKPAKKGCFIATVVYGTYNCPELIALRRYRDDQLMSNMVGRIFVSIYYVIGPAAARHIRHRGAISKAIKIVLDKVIKRIA